MTNHRTRLGLKTTACAISILGLGGGAAAAPSLVVASPQVAAAAAAALLARPRIGLRVGGGPWSDFAFVGGVDITAKLPLLPIPAIRFDAEAWRGGDRSGTAVSVLGVQNLVLGYFGLGPSFYNTTGPGRRNGLGAKLLIGTDLPRGLYLEGGALIGPPSVPLFVTLGIRF